jgi:Zn-dependent M28 family amino/carboxypeptidase
VKLRESVDVHLSVSAIELLGEAPGTNLERETLAQDYLAAFCVPSSYAIAGSHHRSFGCTIQGKSPDRILIGAHYDRKGKGLGVADNWSGVVLTRALLEYYSTREPHNTLEFVLFGEEEPGMLGSRSFLHQRSPDEFDAMINVDTLGLDPLTIDARSSDELECLAQEVAGSLGVETRSLSLRISTGDWDSFRRRGVPVLNLHSLDRRSYRIVHTSRDQLDIVDVERLKGAYRVILNVIENLDGV